MSIKSLFAWALVSIAPLSAQLAPANAAGASIGHFHINAKDIDAQKRFWSAVGGTVTANGKLQMVQFPGIFVVLRKQDSTGGTVGSTVNHVGFHVKSLAEVLPKWKDAGLNIETTKNPKQVFLAGPDDVRVEIIEDATIPGAVEMHHMHLFVPDPLEAQAWYVKHFGGLAGKRGQFDTVQVPGTELTLARSVLQQPTKGRSVDHIGFEVKNIDAFVKQLDADGIHTDAAIRSSGNAPQLRLAYIVDPWGTNIEITQGLAPTPVKTASR